MNRSLFSLAPPSPLPLRVPAGAQTVLTASSWVPPTHAMSVAQKEWCDLLEKNTSGKIKCNILPRAVANPPGTFDAVKNGLADVSFTVHGYTPGRFVLTRWPSSRSWATQAEPLSVAFNKVGRRTRRSSGAPGRARARAVSRTAPAS
jgi:TRAP-type mannitol/chloroaromatic compound transport system substrate-binding protein